MSDLIVGGQLRVRGQSSVLASSKGTADGWGTSGWREGLRHPGAGVLETQRPVAR